MNPGLIFLLSWFSLGLISVVFWTFREWSDFRSKGNTGYWQLWSPQLVSVALFCALLFGPFMWHACWLFTGTQKFDGFGRRLPLLFLAALALSCTGCDAIEALHQTSPSYERPIIGSTPWLERRAGQRTETRF